MVFAANRPQKRGKARAYGRNWFGTVPSWSNGFPLRWFKGWLLIGTMGSKEKANMVRDTTEGTPVNA